MENDTEKMLEGFEEILKYAVKLKNKNQLKIEPMNEIAAEFAKRS